MELLGEQVEQARMVLTELGMVTLVRLLLVNALWLIVVTALPRVRLVAPLKANA